MKNDDVELVHNILSGDGTAFRTLVEKYQKNIHAMAWQRIGDFHIAEEITQDVFLQAYDKLATLKDPNKFSRWLYVIAKRRCTRWLQREKPTMLLSLDDTDEATLDKSAFAHYDAEQREEKAAEQYREIVENLLEKLPENQRTVVVLYYLREMTSEAISKFLGVPINTIKSRLRRARQRLKEEELMICETLGSIQPPIDLTDHIFCDSMEFKADTPYLQDEHTEYTGPQTVKALMSAFDTEFDSNIVKISVGIVGGRSSSLTIDEVDKRYPRTEWFQLILDNGLTIENFIHYASCLSKRHILAFLEDNPDFRKVDFFGIPAQDDWNKYQKTFLSKIIANEKMVREQDKQRHIFCDSMEFKADTPYFQDEHTEYTEYTGSQTVKALMSAFDTEFDSSITKISVGIVGGRSSSLTIDEIDKRYPRTEWLQLILDNGLTIENFIHYASCLSKRHILAFLEDNPDFRKVDFFGIPAQDDWNKYQKTFLSKIIANEKMVREQDKQRHKDEVATDSATE